MLILKALVSYAIVLPIMQIPFRCFSRDTRRQITFRCLSRDFAFRWIIIACSIHFLTYQSISGRQVPVHLQTYQSHLSKSRFPLIAKASEALSKAYIRSSSLQLEIIEKILASKIFRTQFSFVNYLFHFLQNVCKIFSISFAFRVF